MSMISVSSWAAKKVDNHKAIAVAVAVAVAVGNILLIYLLLNI